MRDRFVLLATNSGGFDQSTVELAGRVARSMRAVLVFLHVSPLDANAGEGALHMAASLLSAEQRARLEGVRPTDPSIRFRHELTTGHLEDVVADWVSTEGAELVVYEQPRRSWLSGLLLQQDIARSLIQRLPCPVLVSGPRVATQGPLDVAEPQPVDRRTQLDTLRTLLDARVSALIGWMDDAAQGVQRIAASDLVRSMAWAQRGSSFQSRLRSALGVGLEEHRRAVGALSWELRIPGRTLRPRKQSIAWSLALERFVASVAAHGRATSLPLAMDPDMHDLVVLAGARVECPAGEGMLLFIFDARDQFLRILGQPGPYPSLETYAFDRAGTMLSNSLFSGHLHAAGLLAGAEQTALRLRVAEPTEGPIGKWPLTLMARRATEHGDGFDDQGYLDYRGKRVIGAWRWIEPYGFGVTAEVDAA